MKEMKENIILVDCDGVLCDWGYAFTHWMEHNKNVPVIDDSEYNVGLRFGITKKETYGNFQSQILEKKISIWKFFSSAKKARKKIACYGAPAKGNTLLNYCQIGTDFIDFTVDKNPAKQNKLLPGTHIPIFAPKKINKFKPDYVVILPWNLKDEIIEEMECIRKWGGKFVVLTPKVKIF